MNQKKSILEKKKTNKELHKELLFEHNNLLKNGYLFHQNGQFNRAEEIYNKVLSKNPKNFNALQLNATLMLQNRKYKKALNFYDSAIRVNPKFAPLYKNRGAALKKLKFFDEALKSYTQAIKIRSDYLEAYIERGGLLKELERFDEALESYNNAIQIKPNYAELYNNRGNLLKKLERYDEALESYNIAIQIIPDNPILHNNIGVVLKELKQFDEALKSYDKAIEIKPNYAIAHKNRGVILHGLNRFNEALRSFDKAIYFKHDYEAAYNYRGVTLLYLKNFDDALKSYNQSIKINPNYTEAILHKSFLKLLHGEYLEGWKLYESRKYKVDLKKNYFLNKEELCSSKGSIKGKVILVYSEQGLGDSFQFCRYLRMLKLLNPKDIIFYVDKPLVSIFSNNFKDIKILEKGKEIPKNIDFYCPLLSLPLFFKTTLDSIPKQIGYLSPDNYKNTYWKNKLGKKNLPRIGIVWASSSNKHINKRSLLLSQLIPIFKLPFEYHSLQKDIKHIDCLAIKKIKNLHEHSLDLKDFTDTSAILNQMDLIISVDTSVAHLAAAIGKKTWILINHIPEFRWMLDCDTSPWYPTAKLFRQTKIDDWEPIINKMKDELKVHF